jgi:(2R)-ethylmalonyl-CoA mutase
MPDKPWIFRTYAGHSSAEESNALYRANLAKGQTGLSIAFDLPTQTGYDPDHVLAQGEVGKVGVSIAHIGDMRRLFQDIPLQAMNTSMTINATAAWLLALYIAVAQEQGTDCSVLQGTTQNDIIKEYLSRGTYVFPPAPSMKLTRDIIEYTALHIPKWNPMNVCSYHLQEAGATPVQEVAFALATATAILDGVQNDPKISHELFESIVGRISFFVNAGMRFITEICKLRAFAALWDELCLIRYGIADEKKRMFRYGVQVNSLGLTEPQPENNVHRILIEMLAVTLSKKARARAVQLPAWNEALGLPRQWDQQWSLRMQQVLAFETDLLEFDDIFDGSNVIETKVADLITQTKAELAKIEAMGGAVKAVESGYMKEAMVDANAARISAIEGGRQKVIGVNCFTETEVSPLTAGETNILTVSENVERERTNALKDWCRTRNDTAVTQALTALAIAAQSGDNIMPASIVCAKVGVTTGEWGAVLRGVFGEYRAPTGVNVAVRAPASPDLVLMVEELSSKIGHTPRIVVGKPGLDGHSNGAEQIALRARDIGMDVTYDGIRRTPAEIVARAIEKKADVIGLSILSGSHLPLVRQVMAELRAQGYHHIPVVVGGIIPIEDALALGNSGVTRVYTPKDYKLDAIMTDILQVIDESALRAEEQRIA